MSTENTSRDTPAHPTKAAPACRGQDVRKDAHNDDSDEQAKSLSKPGLATFPNCFLAWVGETGRYHHLDDFEDDLQAFYEEWKDRRDTSSINLEAGYQ